MTLADTNSSQRPLDSIRITGISATGFHGVLQNERETGQEFSVDLTLGLSLGDAAAGDDLEKTVNYAHVAEAVVEIIEGPALNLIETVAERIAAVVLENPLVFSVDVTVHKPQAPIPVPFGGVEVSVSRSRENMPRVARPFVENGADAVATLPSWADVDNERPHENVTEVPHLYQDVVGEDTSADTVTVASAQTEVISESVEGPDPVVVAASVEPVVSNVIVVPQVMTGHEPDITGLEGATEDTAEMAVVDSHTAALSSAVEPETSETYAAREEKEHSGESLLADEPMDPRESILADESHVTEAPDGASDAFGPDETLQETIAPESPEDAKARALEDPENSIETGATAQLDIALDVSEPAEPTDSSHSEVDGPNSEAQAVGDHLVESTEDHERDNSSAFLNAPTTVEAVDSSDAADFFEAVSSFDTDSASQETEDDLAGVSEEARSSDELADDIERSQVGDNEQIAEGSQEPVEADRASTKTPTLSELLGGDKSQPLDLSKPLFLSQDVVELPPLPNPFFESPKTAVQTHSESSQPIAHTQPSEPVSIDVVETPGNNDPEPYQPVFADEIAEEVSPNLASREQIELTPQPMHEPYVPTLSFDQVISGDSAADSAPVTSRLGDQAGAETASSAQSQDTDLSDDTNPNLSASAQQRLEERFAAMMSEHFGIDVPRSPSTTSTPVVDAPVSASWEQVIAGTPANDTTHTSIGQGEPEPWAAAIPVIETEPVELSESDDQGEPAVWQEQITQPATEPESTESTEQFAPPTSTVATVSPNALVVENSPVVASQLVDALDDDANTMVIPVVEPEEHAEDLVRGGTAIFEPPVEEHSDVTGLEEPGYETATRDSTGGEPSMAVRDQLDDAPDRPARVVLALGANMGDAQATLVGAVRALEATVGFEIVKVGPLALTAAVGGPEQGDYYNSVVIGETTLSPRELLKATQAIENAHLRTREVRWGPRTLDIDIITYGEVVATADDLEIPHPRANERAFVLVPWEEADPQAFLPGLGGGPVAALAATAHDRSGIRWLALNWLD